MKELDEVMFMFVFSKDDAFLKKQRHLKAQAFAIKMRPRKETLEVNFVSTTSMILTLRSSANIGRLPIHAQDIFALVLHILYCILHVFRAD